MYVNGFISKSPYGNSVCGDPEPKLCGCGRELDRAGYCDVCDDEDDEDLGYVYA